MCKLHITPIHKHHQLLQRFPFTVHGRGPTKLILPMSTLRRLADATRSFFRADKETRLSLFHRLKESIRPPRIKHLIAIHHRHQILRLRKIDDIVRVPGQHMHCLNLVTGNLPLQHLPLRIIQIPLLNQSVTFHHNKLLKLGIVPMLPLRNPRLRDIEGHLPAGKGMHQLRKASSIIHIHLQRERHLRSRQITQVGRVQLLRKTLALIKTGNP